MPVSPTSSACRTRRPALHALRRKDGLRLRRARCMEERHSPILANELRGIHATTSFAQIALVQGAFRMKTRLAHRTEECGVRHLAICSGKALAMKSHASSRRKGSIAAAPHEAT